jgi:tRNA A-37 threonylcarbamoyl transferase component Bud32
MMRRRWIWGLLLLPVCLRAQQYPFIPVAHSPKNIEHILEDRQGRLWVATHDDVLCFDGQRFFSLHDFGLPAFFPTSLAEDAEGGILIPTYGGLYRFFQGRVAHVFSTSYVDDVVDVAPGVLLATVRPDGKKPTEVVLYRVRAVHGRWEARLLTGWRTGRNLTRDPNGAILATCPGGWCEMPARLIEDWSPTHPTVQVFHKSAFDIDRVLRDRHGCLWLRSNEAAAYQCPGDSQPVPLPANVAGRNVWAGVSEDSNGAMLIASVGSLALGRPGSFQVATPEDGLPADTVSCALRSRDGSIWIGTLGGLYRFPYPFRLTYWKSRHGVVWSFARTGAGILAGTSAGVARLSGGGEWNVLPGSRKFGSISSLLPNPDGSLYASVPRDAVILLGPDGNLAARTRPEQGALVQTLARAADGGIWMGGRGIYRVIRKGSELSLAPENPAGDESNAYLVASDAAGGLWSCFAGSLLRWEPGGWRTVARDGLAPQDICRSMAFDAEGDIWLADGGPFTLVHLDAEGGSVVRSFTSGDEIGNLITAATAYAFGVDSRGWVWRGGSDGMYVADPAQARAGVWLHMNEIDGLSDLDVNHNSLFGDADGSVWWAASTGIMHFYPPPDLIHPAAAPAIFLSAFSVNGASPVLAESFAALPAGKVTAHLGSLQFQARNALRVRYRMLPEQKDWRASSSLDLDLGRAGWGAHTLEFQSRFSMGTWSPTRSSRLVVLRPWWFSWPAILAFAGIGCGGTAGGVRWRRIARARVETSLPDLADWRLAALSPESQLVGVTLDRRFKLLALVARGGFATVFKGRDLRHNGRLCAIKIFRRDVLDAQWLAHRFQQEVSALEQICHPSVVSIYGRGLAPGGTPYLAMEFIEGGTLRDLLAAGPLAIDRVASLLRQITGALEQIHSHGIYHRDLKPENLMLRAGAPSNEELVLIDFSIAIVKEPDQTIHGLSRAAGTIYYMAPEQAVGFATPASDVYSLAKIVLEMLTGKRLSVLLPHASMDIPERVRELVRRLPIPLSMESVEQLGAALEFDPSRRPQTAPRFSQPLVRDLEAASSGLSASPSP